jgi:hypothetical protein
MNWQKIAAFLQELLTLSEGNDTAIQESFISIMNNLKK